MLLRISYLLMRWLFGLVVLVFRGDEAKDTELLVLRHENAVLRRHASRVRYEPASPVQVSGSGGGMAAPQSQVGGCSALQRIRLLW